jgi:hypothetical protein
MFIGIGAARIRDLRRLPKIHHVLFLSMRLMLLLSESENWWWE